MATEQSIVDKLRKLEQTAKDMPRQPVEACQEACKRDYLPIGMDGKFCGIVLEKRIAADDKDTDYCALRCPYRQKPGGK